MAAGMGSRYGGLKQIDPVGPSGEIVLDYSVYDAIQAGFGKVVFIIRPDIEAAFKEIIGTKLNGKIKAAYVFQTLEKIPPEFSVPAGRTKPWGTGQAVLVAGEEVREPFAVINADDFYGRESFKVMAGELRKIAVNSSDSSMVGFYIRNTISPNGAVTRGQCVVKDGFLQTVIERFKIERKEDGVIRYEDGGRWFDMGEDEISSMNMWGFTPALFACLRSGFSAFLREQGGEQKSEYLLPMIIDGMIREKATRVKVLNTNEKWMGVTYPEDKPLVMAGIRELISKGVYPGNLWK
jgi:choline kinase